MIVLEDVTKVYEDRTAVDRLSLQVPRGEVCVLIGPSGCGKTTTLRMMNRLVEPTSGRILIDGRDVSTIAPSRLRRDIGYAIQSVGLFPHLTVEENVATVPRLLKWDRRRIASRVEEVLTLVGLDPAEYARTYPARLSGGEAQRVGVARALAADPPVLLMDEPFGAVDPLTRERLQSEFARIQRELRKTVVFVTHDVDEAIRLADSIALMRDGRLVQYTNPEEILDHPVDRFAHDFMGADRALKRLGRVQVGEVMRAAPSVEHDGADAAELLRRTRGERHRFVYLLDPERRLEGWFDRRAAATDGHEAGITAVDRREVSVTPDITLRDALSRMLGLGFRSIPVIDDDGHLVGEVGLTVIESTLEGGDTYVGEHGEEGRDG